MHTTVIPYHDKSVDLERFVTLSEERKGPLVILCHTCKGRDEFICEKAQLISKLGYVGFALDIYGNAMYAFVTPGSNDPEEGILYNPIAVNCAWITIQNFLVEVLIK